MKISSKFLALLLGGAVLVAGCEEKNTGNGKKRRKQWGAGRAFP